MRGQGPVGLGSAGASAGKTKATRAPKGDIRESLIKLVGVSINLSFNVLILRDHFGLAKDSFPVRNFFL